MYVQLIGVFLYTFVVTSPLCEVTFGIMYIYITNLSDQCFHLLEYKYTIHISPLRYRLPLHSDRYARKSWTRYHIFVSLCQCGPQYLVGWPGGGCVYSSRGRRRRRRGGTQLWGWTGNVAVPEGSCKTMPDQTDLRYWEREKILYYGEGRTVIQGSRVLLKRWTRD